jgi:hypothetical protein
MGNYLDMINLFFFTKQVAVRISAQDLKLENQATITIPNSK